MQLVKRVGARLLFLGTCLISSQQLYADSLSLAISGDSAEIGFNTGGDYSDSIDWGSTIYFNSVKPADEKQTSDKMLTLDLETSLEGDSSSPVLFSLGGSIYLLSLERVPRSKNSETETDFNAGITLGGKIGYMLTTAVPSIFYLAGGVSPNIINTGKVEHLRTTQAMFELMLSPAAILQLGFRNYHVSLDKRYEHLEESNKTIENRVVGGIKLRF